MPYENAYRIYNDPNSTILDYAHAIKELGFEEGYITGTVYAGFRLAVGCEADLLKILLLGNALQNKLLEITEEKNNDRSNCQQENTRLLQD